MTKCSHFTVSILAIIVAISSSSLLPAEDYEIPGPCSIAFLDELDIMMAASKPGLLTEVKKEGDAVSTGEIVSRVDDGEAQKALEIAQRQYDVAKLESEDDVNIRFSEKNAKVDEADYQAGLDANKREAGAISKSEMRRRKLAAERGGLSVEKAELDQTLAEMTAQVRLAEVEANEIEVSRRRVICPIDGFVAEKIKEVGEWVNPGEEIMRVVGLHRLEVEGFVQASEWQPAEIRGRSCTVTVHLARGETREFTSSVTFVDNTIEDVSRDFRVRCQIDNPTLGADYLLRPGMEATMVIHDL